MKNQIQPIGILGGTFDPIHFSHLRAAVELDEELNFSQLRFLPCQLPVHKKDAHASKEHRLAMLSLGIKATNFIIDKRELERGTPSYMILSLESLRQELGAKVSLCLIIGSDAAQQFASWHRYREIFNLAHIVVMQRPDFAISEINIFKDRVITDKTLLHTKSHGHVFFQPITQLNISSTQIRSLIQQQKSPRFLLPDSVLNYIEKHGLYR